MSLDDSDIATLRAQAIHDMGKCSLDPGKCEWCMKEEDASEDADREMGIEEGLESVGDK